MYLEWQGEADKCKISTKVRVPTTPPVDVGGLTENWTKVIHVYYHSILKEESPTAITSLLEGTARLDDYHRIINTATIVSRYQTAQPPHHKSMYQAVYHALPSHLTSGKIIS